MMVEEKRAPSTTTIDRPARSAAELTVTGASDRYVDLAIGRSVDGLVVKSMGGICLWQDGLVADTSTAALLTCKINLKL